MEFKQPFFTVIVPVYNTEKYLKDCLKSLISQKFIDFEVIIIDDGSPASEFGSAGKIVKEIVKDDERFHIHRKVNGGVASARNFGIDKAKGLMVTFIDSDDWVDNQYLSKVFEKIKEGEYSRSLYYYRSSYLFTDGVSEINNFKTRGFKQELVNFSLIACNVFISKELISDTRFPDFRPEDQSFYLEICFNYLNANKEPIKFIAIEDKGYYYRQHESSYTSLNLQNKFYHQKNMIKTIDYLENKVSPPIYYKIILSLSKFRQKTYLENGFQYTLKRKIISFILKLLTGWYM